MILDSFLNFTGGSGGIGNNDGLTDSPTTGTQACSNVLDLGVKSGIPSSASGGGARDIGIGDDPAMKILVQVTVAFTVGTNMQTILQGAPDDGSGGIGTYATFLSGALYLEANLVVGAQLLQYDMPRPPYGMASVVTPRYLRIEFVTSGTHSTGKVAGTLVLDRFDTVQQANAVLGAYPAGVTVSN